MNDRANFYYDPARQGYDTTLWKTITGAPVSTGTALRFNVAKAIGYGDLFKVETSMKVTVPVTPVAYLTGGNGASVWGVAWTAVTDGSFAITINGTARSISALDFSATTNEDGIAAVIQAGIRTATGALETVVWSTDHFIITTVSNALSAITVTSATGAGTDISGAGATAFMDSDVGHGVVTAAAGDREFGLEQITQAAKITFKIASGALSCVSMYEGLTSTTVIPWNSAWTATGTVFTIKWTGFSAEFLINGVRQLMLRDTEVLSVPTVKIPKVALSQMIRNTTADNMDVAYIQTSNVQGYL